jgi:hypothetical protein
MCPQGYVIVEISLELLYRNDIDAGNAEIQDDDDAQGNEDVDHDDNGDTNEAYNNTNVGQDYDIDHANAHVKANDLVGGNEGEHHVAAGVDMKATAPTDAANTTEERSVKINVSVPKSTILKVKMSNAIPNVESKNVKSQNAKSQNDESKNVKSQNAQSQNAKIHNVESKMKC